MTFREAFCQHFHCPASAYGSNALRRFLYPHAVWIFCLLRLTRNRVVDLSLSTVEEIGNAQCSDDVSGALDRYRCWLELNGGLLSKYLKCRLSGQRIVRHCDLFFKANRELSERPSTSR
jgi:hypothetical protein